MVSNITTPSAGSRRSKPRILGAVHANVGEIVAYRRRLDVLIERMAAETARTVARLWDRNPPALAADASTTAEAQESINRLRHEWEKRFAEFGNFGKRFAEEISGHADKALKSQLRKLGFTVEFRMTAAANEVLRAAIVENVSLIKSIPEQYFTRIESIVMSGVRVGRDMHGISEALQHQLGVTKRRAAIIARDQANKATAATVRVRQQEIGATEAVWLHSGGGKHPRPAHVRMNGKRYEIAKGMWDRDEGKFVWPGELINCRCVSRAVVPGVT